MQSATSDVNAAVVKMRDQLIFAVDSKNSQKARHSIYTLNEILPANNQIIFDTNSYQKAIMSIYSITCKCGKESEVSENTIKYQKPKKSFGRWSQEFTSCVITKYIECIHCKHEVTINSSKMILEKKSRFADRYVFEEPATGSLYDKALNGSTYWEWVLVCHATLERQFRLFRESYSTKDTDIE